MSEKYYSPDWLRKNGLYWTGKTFPYNPKLKKRALEMRKNMTKAEKKLWYDFLSKHKVKFVRQKIIGHYIIDFYCAKYRLAIEIDGSYHYQNDRIVYDRARTEILSTFEVNLIRFTNEEIFNEFEKVKGEINKYLKPFVLRTFPL